MDRKWKRVDVRRFALNFCRFLREDCLVQRGQVVLFWADNSDIHAMAIVGCVLAGAVYASVASHSTEREIQQLVALFKPKVLISNSAPKELDARGMRVSALLCGFLFLRFSPFKVSRDSLSARKSPHCLPRRPVWSKWPLWCSLRDPLAVRRPSREPMATFCPLSRCCLIRR